MYLLINDIVLEEDDRSVVRTATLAQLDKAWLYILACSTGSSEQVDDHQSLWRCFMYDLVKLINYSSTVHKSAPSIATA